MFPKEHGAYGQLLFPIATVFAIGRFTLPAVALAAAAMCAFVAHEPLLVLLGQRGPRAQRELRGRAWRWLSAFGGAALAFSVAAALTLPETARLALGVTAGLALGLAGFIAAKREHTVVGESAMSATMGSLAAPLALAAGASTQAAITLAGAFVAAFVAPTVAVHAVIACTRRPPAAGARLGSAAATAGVAAAVWIAMSSGHLAAPAVWAVAPACAVAGVLAIRPPPARRLRAVGWTLVATSTAAAVILIAGLRPL